MKFTHEQISEGLRRAQYITNERVETAIFLALALEKPLLIEGPAGSGKTEVAKVLAEILHTELIRLQCYEGLDEARALYEWNYQKQLLRMQADEQQGLRWEELSEHIFSRDYLLERPLLKAITAPRRIVLLIDEIDKADEEFEAFLLELLSDFQISVPELGTLKAHERPAVILTSNRARELSEALRRRCLHLFIDFPGIEQERKIIELKVPELDAMTVSDRRPAYRAVARASHCLGQRHTRLLFGSRWGVVWFLGLWMVSGSSVGVRFRLLLVCAHPFHDRDGIFGVYRRKTHHDHETSAVIHLIKKILRIFSASPGSEGEIVVPLF